jgi:AGZA family xanthine/uracil permease-like MFS transporter
MKHSFAVGIGLFLTFIGLYQTGIVTSAVEGMTPEQLLMPGKACLRAPDVPVKIGNLHEPQVMIAILGFILVVTLIHWRVKGAILLGIIITALLGSLFGVGHGAGATDASKEAMRFAALPFTGEYDLSQIALQLDIAGVLELSMLPVLLTLFLMSFLDTLGTLVGVGAIGNMLDSEGNFPNVERPMLVDAATCMFSAAVGTSTSGAYIESAAGIREGARTGLAAVVTGILFAITLFFIPLVEPLQKLSYAYGPALIAVGILMTSSIARIRFEDWTELVPAFVTIVMMIFTYNIGNGLTAGLLLYPILKVAAGRWKDLNYGSLLLGLLCAVYYFFGLPH